MNKLISFLRSEPVFFLLLPLFFVLHGSVENFKAIPFRDALLLLLLYVSVALGLFLLSWLFYRDKLKAGLLTFCLLGFHFFFGSLQDFLKNIFESAWITRYSFLIPFLLIVLLLVIVLLKKGSLGKKVGFYLNILLSIIVVIDLAWLLSKIVQSQNSSINQTVDFKMTCDTCAKPDIYFLVFDEYTSTTALKELWNYDNSDLDSFLVERGFYMIPYSKSNYNFTEFSIASTLNMDWLQIPDTKACTVKDYNRCFDLIKNSKVSSILKSIGYKIVNYSIFDLEENPSPVTEDFLPLKTKLITSQTFLSRIRKDLYYHLLTGKFKINWLARDLVYTTYYNNQKIIDATLHESRDISTQPKFIYSHIEMPHPPFYFNQQGQQRDKRVLITENKKPTINSYINYLPKTNEVLRQIVDSILDHAKKPVVIIIMGDHGFRTKQREEYYFRNLNAVYISSRNYGGFYETMTNVNEFRVLFNNLFQTEFLVLKDSTSFLKDK